MARGTCRLQESLLYPILVRGITKGEDGRLHGKEGDNCRLGSNVGGIGTLWPEDTGTGLVRPIVNFPSKIDHPERQDMAGPRGPRPAVHTSVR